MQKSTGLVLALALLACGAAQSALAQDVAYVVSYIETKPAAQNEAAALVRAFGEASRKEDGNLRFDVMQRMVQTNHFAIVEAWKDAKAQAAHAAAPGTKQFREKLQAMLRSPYDERPHSGLAVGALQMAGAPRDAVYVVTHVDFIPPGKDAGIELIKVFSEASRKDGGNLRFETLQQTSRPNHLTLFEAWKDAQAVDSHGVAPHTLLFREKSTPISGALFDERFYKSIN
jgi:quinol monooxygenase YgiN